MIANHIFDLDGTLVDSVPGIDAAVFLACKDAGVAHAPSSMRSYIGPPIRSMLREALETEDMRLLDCLEQAFRHHYDLHAWKESCPYPGVDDTLQALRTRGRRLCLLTNKPRLPTLKILEHFGWSSWFDRIVTPDMPGFQFACKEDAAMAMRDQMGLSASETLLVGDSADDYKAAQAAGFHFAAANWGYGDAARLAPGCQINAFNQLLNHTAFGK